MDGLALCRKVRRAFVHVHLFHSGHQPQHVGRHRHGTCPPGPTTLLASRSTRPSCWSACARANDVLSLESRDIAIFAMAKLTESRDHETGQHLERVRSYAQISRPTVDGVAEVPRHHRRQIRAADLRDQPAARYRKGRHSGQHSAQARQTRPKREMAIMRTHTTLGKADARFGVARSIPMRSFCGSRGTSSLVIMSASTELDIRTDWQANRNSALCSDCRRRRRLRCVDVRPRLSARPCHRTKHGKSLSTARGASLIRTSSRRLWSWRLSSRKFKFMGDSSGPARHISRDANRGDRRELAPQLRFH